MQFDVESKELNSAGEKLQDWNRKYMFDQIW